MATRYVWSGAAGSGTGADWTNAYTTLAAAVTAAAAGDDIRVAHDHAETASSSAAVSYSMPGTNTNPLHVICVDRTTGELADTASIKTVGPYGMTLTGSASSEGIAIQGMHFVVGEGATSSATLTMTKARVFKDCTFEGKNTTGGLISMTAAARYRWDDCWVKTAASNQYVTVAANELVWDGGGVLSGYAGAILFNIQSTLSTITARNLDLSAAPASLTIFNPAAPPSRGILRDSKLPAGYSGELAYLPLLRDARVSMYNCDSGDTNYRLWIQDYAGKIVDETAIFLTDGFKVRDQSNVQVGYALKCTTNSVTNEFMAPLETDPIIRAFPGTAAEQAAFTPGASKTITVEIAHSAGAPLTNAQAWLKVSHLATDGSPLGDTVITKRASALVTPTDCATSAEGWSGTAQTYRQKLTATIAPQAPGVIEVVVCLATGNNVVVYVNPMFTVS